MEHFQLHFEPQHRVLYQEPTGAWLTASWKDIATSPSIKRIQYNTEQLQNYIIVDIDNSDIYKYREALLWHQTLILSLLGACQVAWCLAKVYLLMLHHMQLMFCPERD